MGGKVMEIKDTDFEKEVLQSEVPVLVDFWAPWCAPCRMIAPFVEQLADEYEGRAKVAKINIDDNQAIAQQYRVMQIPSLIVFKGGQPVQNQVGAIGKPQIEDMLKKAL